MLPQGTAAVLARQTWDSVGHAKPVSCFWDDSLREVHPATEAWAGFRSMHHLLVTVLPSTQGNIPFKFLYLNPCLAACWCVGSNYSCKKPDSYLRLALRHGVP